MKIALTLLALLGLAAPAIAAGPAHTPAQRDALETVTQPLTPTLADDRVAATTYLDDALSLLALAHANMERGRLTAARHELMGASGKLTTAHLLMFKDRDFSARMHPLTLRIDEVMAASDRHPRQALGRVEELRGDVRTLYRSQVAKLGGGAGRALEPLNHQK